MLLAVDVGNTQTVLGVYRGKELVHHFRVESASSRTSDEYRVLLSQLMREIDLTPSAIDACIMASVVPVLGETFRIAIEKTFSVTTLIVGPGIRTGMPVLYDNPKEVGADRIVNAVAAFERFGGGAIVVDFGTATTFDCISPKGEYLGGVIAPGVRVSAEALAQKAAKLPRAEIRKPQRVVGRNTLESMQSGFVYGYVALVDGLVARLKEELNFPCAVIATGGLARLIHSESTTIEELDDNLTLDGLRILFERNCCDAA
ncbi:MAG: type III pantothenate kinase [Myxococcales bacterium]|nr:MAG: type III pantothenate kinase [Myxococcales bacterium]